MADRSTNPSGFARVFAPVLGLLAIGGVVAALKGRRKPSQAEVLAGREPGDDLEGADGHPS